MEEEFVTAAEEGDLDEVRRLVFSGEVVDPNSTDATSDGRTALHGASLNGHLAVVRQLVEKWRVDVEVEDRHGWTPLHLACWRGHFEVAKCLVEKGEASIDGAKDSSNCTPLHYACSNGSLELVEYLVDHRNADATIETNNGETPLLIACARGFVAVVSFLLPQSPVDARVIRLAWRRKFPWYLKMKVVEQYARQRLGGRADYFSKHPLHTFFQCPLPSEEAYLECLYQCFDSVATSDEQGRLPLHVLLEAARTTNRITPFVIGEMLRLERRAEASRDPSTGFYPYQAVACAAGTAKVTGQESDSEDDDDSNVCDDSDNESLSDLSDSDDDGAYPDNVPREARELFPHKTTVLETRSDWLDFVYLLIRQHDPAKLLLPTLSIFRKTHDSQV